MDSTKENTLRKRFKTINVFNTLGFEFIAFEEGFCRVHVPRKDEYKGVYKTYHGGLMTTVADCAAWIAIVTRLGHDADMTTTDIHVRFLNPCFTGVTAEARVLKFGKTLCPVDVELFDDEGTLVARAQVTYFLLGSGQAKREE